jgi:hypothetical protein
MRNLGGMIVAVGLFYNLVKPVEEDHLIQDFLLT